MKGGMEGGEESNLLAGAFVAGAGGDVDAGGSQLCQDIADLLAESARTGTWGGTKGG